MDNDQMKKEGSLLDHRRPRPMLRGAPAIEVLSLCAHSSVTTASRTGFLLAVILGCLHHVAALKITPAAISGRREVLRAAVLLPLYAGATAAHAADAGAAVTPEGEASFQVVYQAALKAKEEKYKAMDLEVDDDVRKELENNLRIKYCGFPAEMRCKPPAKLKK
jgi:hypothetical protein